VPFGMPQLCDEAAVIRHSDTESPLRRKGIAAACCGLPAM
jgi:hypothetical protein